MRKRIVLTSMIAAAALMLVLSLMAYAQNACPMQGKKVGLQGMRKMHGQGRFAANKPFAFLNLTQDQKKDMAEIWKSHREEIRPIQAKVMAKRGELMRLLSAVKPNRGKIRDVSRDLSNLRNQIAEAKVDSLLKAQNVLTPKQKEKLANRLHKMDSNKEGKGCEGMKRQ